MKKISSLVLGLSLLLVACVDTTGLSEKSSRTPQGNPNAAVVVTEFGDLQCPACRTAYTTINLPLLQKYGNQIRFDFMHFPLQSIHRYALEAAMASECAADQGKFWEFVDVAYVNQTELSKAKLNAWAENLGLDMPLFKRCRASKIKKSTILADYEQGLKQGVAGTPTYFVNGEPTPATLEKLSEKIDAALKGAIQKL